MQKNVASINLINKDNKYFIYAIFVSILLHLIAVGNLNLLPKKEPKNEMTSLNKVKAFIKKESLLIKDSLIVDNSSHSQLLNTEQVKSIKELPTNKKNIEQPALTKKTIISNNTKKTEKLNEKKNEISTITSNNQVKNEVGNASHIEISESTKDYKYSQYFDDWKKKVERIGSMNYPSDIQNATLVLKVILKSDGSVVSSKIIKSSGNPVADEAALNTIIFGAPYAKFPDSIKNEHEYMDITKTWHFSKNRLITY